VAFRQFEKDVYAASNTCVSMFRWRGSDQNVRSGSKADTCSAKPMFRCYSNSGQKHKATVDYETALKINPKLAGALYGRGLTKRKKSDVIADADIAAAKAIQSDIAEKFELYSGLK